jgi:hypothetical protein
LFTGGFRDQAAVKVTVPPLFAAKWRLTRPGLPLNVISMRWTRDLGV